MRSKNSHSSELTLQIEQNAQNIYFLQNTRRFKKVTLNSLEQEEYFIGNDPIPESISASIEFYVLDNTNPLELLCTSNGLTRAEEEAIKKLIDQVNTAVSKGTSLSIEISSILDLSSWVIMAE